MTMDTGSDAETADFLRSLRTTTQAEVDERAAQHDAQVRYEVLNGHAPHTAAAH